MTVAEHESSAPTATVEPLPAKPRRGRSRLVWLILSALAVTGGAHWWFAGDTYHLATVQPGVLYRDGNQGLRRFDNAVEKVSPKTVVVLVDDKEIASSEKPQFAQELDYLKQKGVKVERIPVPLGGWPTSEDVQKFLAVVGDRQNQPVMVHCAQGVRRTGMMVAAYQMSVEGMDKEKAKQSILTFGHSERTVGDVKKFIDGYDPQRRTATTLPVAGAKE